MAITRTTLTDDSGDNLTGTIWNNARLQAVFDAIETNWVTDAYTPTWGNTGTPNTTTDATITGSYFKIGKLCFFQIALTWGAATASGNGAWTFTLPLTANAFGANSNIEALYVNTGTASYRGTALALSTTSIQAVTNASPVATVTSTSPFTWGNTDVLYITGWYFLA